MDKKYYTVAEFAKKAGISRQAVYQAIDSKKLNHYVKEIDGLKYIHQNAFVVFSSKSGQAVDSKVIQLLDRFWGQIEEKDIHIANLNEQVNLKDVQIEKLQELVFSQQQQLTELTKAFREAQALHAGTIQRELSDNTTAKNKHRWWNFWHKGK